MAADAGDHEVSEGVEIGQPLSQRLALGLDGGECFIDRAAAGWAGGRAPSIGASRGHPGGWEAIVEAITQGLWPSPLTGFYAEDPGRVLDR